MFVAKLNDGRLVVVLKYKQKVLFAKGNDWCLCYTNLSNSGHLDARPRKRDLFWIPSTCIVWILFINMMENKDV